MNTSPQHIDLDAFLDGDLAPEARQAAEAHLAGCAVCREDLAALRAIIAEVAALPRHLDPPDDLWPGLAARLTAPSAEAKARRSGAAVRAAVPVRRPRRVALRGVFAAAVVLAMVWGGYVLTERLARPGWAVAVEAGTPRIDSGAVVGGGELHPGEWLETDGAARATLAVGTIGTVEVEPNSRLRLVTATPTEHRLALDRGTIHARILAPPRLFLVETPGALAVDLGCAYTLRVEADGGGLLHVTEGYVALEDAGRAAVVPAGAMARLHGPLGPGTPFAEDAPEALREALDRLDVADDASALDVILAHARPEDALTLWHLVFRRPAAEAARVYARLAVLVPPPTGTTAAGVLAGDAAMIDAWQRHLGFDLDVTEWWIFSR